MGQHAFARAYINFVNSEDVYLFQEKFDGYVFVDNKGRRPFFNNMIYRDRHYCQYCRAGNDYSGLVEFAPNPKFSLVKESKRKDPKVGTVEQDPDYIKFLEEKEQGNNKDEVGCQLYDRFYKNNLH